MAKVSGEVSTRTKDVHGAEELGARITPDGTRFRVWSTKARRVDVVLYGQDGSEGQDYPLEARGQSIFEGTYRVSEGTLYKFKLDGQPFPDPYARCLPLGVHGPARVCASDYPWTCSDWAGVDRDGLVIYELHVGTFTPETTFAAARSKLPHLATLGVTAIEVMPIASFPGKRGWGYDGVALFAPFVGYGSPDDFRAFVDAAHAQGIGVILDVVYNHFGPDGNYLSVYSPEYFTDRFHTAWGASPDFTNPYQRRLVLDNARYWLEEFQVDGLRLDATHAIHDPSPVHIIEELHEFVHQYRPKRLLIAEDERNDPGLVTRCGVDAIWADDFHHQVHVLLTGEQDGYYGEYRPALGDLVTTIERGWLFEGKVWSLTSKPRGAPADRLEAAQFVYCLQNHDQIGNRALGDRLNALTSLDAFCAATMLLCLLPMTPLLFMGQEWGATSPFLYFTDHHGELGALITKGRRSEFGHFAAFADVVLQGQIPDPQEGATFERSKLRWQERDEPPHREVWELHRRLLELRRIDAVLSRPSRERLRATADGTRLLVRRWWQEQQRLLVIDFGPMPDIAAPSSEPTLRWELLLASGDTPERPSPLPPARAALYGGTV